jgi:hypothetical protein
MIHLLILVAHLLATIAKLLRPGGVRTVVAESLLLKLRRPIDDDAFALDGRNRPAILGDDGDAECQPVNLEGPSEAMSGWIPESLALLAPSAAYQLLALSVHRALLPLHSGRQPAMRIGL